MNWFLSKKRTTHYHADFVFFVILFFLCAPTRGQIIISEVMANPAGTETTIPGGDSNEFIELFNAGTTAVNISGWTFADNDAVDGIVPGENRWGSNLPSRPGIYNTTIIPPGGFALILDPEYTDIANIQPYLWPGDAIILSITSGTDLGGSRLATNDPVFLMDSSGDTVDAYLDPFDPGDGISAERLSPAFLSGWGACISPSGSTPGYRNSRWRYDYDLSLDSLTRAGSATTSPILLKAHIRNAGENPITGATVHLFEDSTYESLLDSARIPVLDVDDMISINLSAGLPNGSYRLCAVLSEDDNIMNNSATLSIFIGPSGYPICISEIMFMPISGQTEWIEIYNSSDESFDLAGWKFGDAVGVHNLPSIIIEPEEFVVLCQDTAGFIDTVCEGGRIIKTASWPILNNDEDDVRILDAMGILRHLVHYKASAMGGCMTYGISAEVIVVGGSAVACCPAGRTPGCENVFWKTIAGEAKIEAEPNPFDPTKEKTLIKISMPSGGITAKIFDRQGRRMVTLCDPSNPRGFEFEWDGRDENGKILPSGLYILFAEDSGGNSAKCAIALKGAR